MTALRENWVAAVLGVASGIAYWVSLRYGVALSPDSMFYLNQSSGLAQEFSLSALNDRAPPLYPMMQFLSTAVFGETFLSLKVLHTIVFSINTYLFAILARSYTQGSRLFGVIGGVLHALSPAIYGIHAYALSEPLFITAFISALLFWERHRDSTGSVWLSAAGVAVGVMILTRFAGVAFLGSLALCVAWVARDGGLNRVLREVLRFAAPAVALPVSWSILKLLLDPSTSSPRTLQIHLFGGEHIRNLFDVFAEWLLAGESVVVFIVVAAAGGYILFRFFRSPGREFPLFAALNIAFYIAFVFFSLSFFDAHIPIDSRILLPCFYLLLLLLLEASHRLLSESSHWANRTAVSLVLGILAIQGASATAAIGVENYTVGRGFTSKPIQELALHKIVKDHSAGIIYTNAPELIQLYVGKPAILLPRLVDPNTRLENEQFVDEISSVLTAVDNGEAAIVHYHAVTWRTYVPNPDFFTEQFGISPVLVSSEGALFAGPLR